MLAIILDSNCKEGRGRTQSLQDSSANFFACNEIISLIVNLGQI